MQIACLVDTTRCIGCRSCQVACKRAHDLSADKTRFFPKPGGFQNPGGYTSQTRTVVSFHEIPASDGVRWVFAKQQCLHCTELRCAVVCPPQLFQRTASGIVAYAADQCLGCGACIDACPLAVPAIDYWNSATPQVRKCDFCIERQESPPEECSVNGVPLSGLPAQRLNEARHTPACVQACPADALHFGPREAVLAEARRRIAAEPERYIDHVYGEHELGGTSWLYLSAVPFEQIGLPTQFAPFAGAPKFGAVPPQSPVPLAGALSALTSLPVVVAGMTARFFQRRDEVRRG